jgi:hypothetical protein
VAESKRDIAWARITAEFVVIVLGVTVALLADEWRQSHQDRALEADLLQRLIEDVSWDLQRLDIVDASSADAARAATSLLVSIDDPLRHVEQNPSRANDADTVSTDPGEAVWNSILLRQFGHRRATYDEMIATGSIGVLHNLALRGEISRYYALVAGSQFLLTERPGSDALVEALGEIGLSAGGDIRWVEDPLAWLGRIPNLGFLLRDQRYRTGQRTFFSGQIRDAATAILRDLRAECGSRCPS